MNLLYCFDDGYNKQACLSILSFAKQNLSDINIYIIHQNPGSFDIYKDILKNYKNISLYFYKFNNKDNIQLPLKEFDHISEATYYRLFIEQHLPVNLREILYVDADVFCINNIENRYIHIFNEMNKSKFTIAARNDGSLKNNEKLFKDLNLKDSYFNAGVMFINLELWRKSNTTNFLIEKLEEIKHKITFWDQDVLNAHFDGEYFQLDEGMNFYPPELFDNEKYKQLKRNVSLIHYAGSKKPWKLSGGINFLANFYHDLHYDVFEKHHITFDYKRVDFFNLIKSVFTLRIFELNYPLQYIKETISNLINNHE